MRIDRMIFTVSYLLVMAGSGGMVAFARKFPFASGGAWELRHTEERFLRLNGYQVWVYSWLAILLGTAGQIIATWCQA